MLWQANAYSLLIVIVIITPCNSSYTRPILFNLNCCLNIFFHISCYIGCLFSCRLACQFGLSHRFVVGVCVRLFFNFYFFSLNSHYLIVSLNARVMNILYSINHEKFHSKLTILFFFFRLLRHFWAGSLSSNAFFSSVLVLPFYFSSACSIMLIFNGMFVCPPERNARTHTNIHYIRYIHFYFHLMDGIWHYACCTNAHLVYIFFSRKKEESDGREYIEIIIWAGYVFFNNLDCAYMIMMNRQKWWWRRRWWWSFGIQPTTKKTIEKKKRETLFENQMWLIFRRKKSFSFKIDSASFFFSLSL